MVFIHWTAATPILQNPVADNIPGASVDMKVFIMECVPSLSFSNPTSIFLSLFTWSSCCTFNFRTVMFFKSFQDETECRPHWLVFKEKWLTAKPELMLWQGTALAEVLFVHSDKRLQALQVNHVRKKPNFVNQKFRLLPEQTRPCILLSKAVGTPCLLWLTWTELKFSKIRTGVKEYDQPLTRTRMVCVELVSAHIGWLAKHLYSPASSKSTEAISSLPLSMALPS